MEKFQVPGGPLLTWPDGTAPDVISEEIKTATEAAQAQAPLPEGGESYDPANPSEGLPVAPENLVTETDQSVSPVPEKRGIVPDVARSAIDGLRDGAESTLQLLSKDIPLAAADGLRSVLGMEELPTPTNKLPSLPDFKGGPDTTAGEITREVTRFAGGMVGGGAVLKAAGWGTGVLPFVRSIAQGAIADFTVIAEGEKRLSDFIETTFPDLSNPLTAYLKSDPDDSWAEARFKNVLEGGILGGAAEIVFRTAKLAKKGLMSGVEERRQELAEEAAKLLDDEAVVAGGGVLPKVADSVVGEGNALQRAGMVTDGPTFGADLPRVDLGTPAPSAERLPNEPFVVFDITKPSGAEGVFPTKEAAENFIKARPNAADLDVGSPRDVEGFNHDPDETLEAAMRRLGTLLDQPKRANDEFDIADEIKAVGPRDIINVSDEAATAEGRVKQPGVSIPDEAVARVRGAVAEFEEGMPSTPLHPDADVAARAAKAGMTFKDIEHLRTNFDAAKEGKIDWNTAVGEFPFNAMRLTGPDDAKAVIKILVDELNPYFPADFKAVQSHQEVIDLAEMLGTRPATVLANMRAVAGTAEIMPAMLIATKGFVQGMANAIPELSRKVLNGNLSIDEFKAYFGTFATTVLDLKSVQKMGARMTSAGNIDVVAQTVDIDAIIKEGVKLGYAPDAVLKVLSKIDQPSWLLKGFNAIFDGKWWDRINEYRINAMLSNPKTHLVNMVSNTAMSLLKPLEEAAGSIALGDVRGASGAIGRYYGMGTALLDSLKTARRAWLDGDNILDTTARIDDRILDGRGTPKAIEGMAGTAIRTPSRFLMAEDEFFKQINYRARLRELAHNDAGSRGLTGDSYKNHVAEFMENGFDAHGRATNAQAVAYAQELTFTSSLASNPARQTVGAWIQKGGNIGAVRFILPFQRTPVNLFRQSWQRTPGIGLFQHQMRLAWQSGDQNLRAAVIGKQVTGMALLGTAGFLASEGLLTGGGPRDPFLRQAQETAGWKPYSVKIGGDWYSFERLDPIGMTLGMMADWFEVAEQLSDTQAEDVTGGMLLAFMSALGDGDTESLGLLAKGVGSGFLATSKNLTSKTYLRGLTDFLEAISSGESYQGDKLWDSVVQSFVPNILRATNLDENLREMRGALDGIIANTPGLSDTLPPKFDFMGQPRLKRGSYGDRVWNPISKVTPSTDPLALELARLKHPFSPVQDKRGNVEVWQFRNKEGKDAYVRWNELIANPGGNTPGLQDRLRTLIASEPYKKLTDDVSYQGDRVYTGSRVTLIQSLINDHRELAFALLSRESFVNDKGASLKDTLIADEVGRGIAQRDPKKSRDIISTILNP